MARTRGRTILGGSGAGPSNRTATGGSQGSTLSSPMSMGELVKHVERRAQDLSRNYNKGGKIGTLKGSLFEGGAKFAQRAILGRTYSRANSGIRYGSYIFRGVTNLARNTKGYSVTVVKIYQKFRFTMPPSFVLSRNCGIAPSFLTGAAAYASCGGLAVVAKTAINASLNNSIISGFRYVADYTSSSVSADKCFRYTRPSGVTERPTIVRTAGTRFWPGDTVTRLVPFKHPLSWARAFDRPASEFSTPGDTETFSGSDAPWNNSSARAAAKGAGLITRGWPYGTFGPSTQTLTPPKIGPSAGAAPSVKPGNPSKPSTGTGTKPGTENPGKPQVDNPSKPRTDTPTKPQPDKPAPPPVTKPGVPPSQRPRKGDREVKFGGKPILVRVLRAVLGVTEVIDTLDALIDAIPDDKTKQCRRLARKRYWDAKNSGRQIGSLNWQMTPQEKIICLGKNLEQLDLNEVYYNLIKNELEDMWAGWQYGAIDRELQISRPHGGPTSTRNPLDHKPLKLPEWDDPFWDEVAEYLKSEGL